MTIISVSAFVIEGSKQIEVEILDQWETDKGLMAQVIALSGKPFREGIRIRRRTAYKVLPYNQITFIRSKVDFGIPSEYPKLKEGVINESESVQK